MEILQVKDIYKDFSGLEVLTGVTFAVSGDLVVRTEKRTRLRFGKSKQAGDKALISTHRVHSVIWSIVE